MIRIILFIFLWTMLVNCSSKKETNHSSSVIENESYQKQDSIEVKIIPSIENTFGYEIWINGTKTFVQTNIPGIAGSKGFSSEGKAKKIADLVVSKIRKNEMPPSVTPQELDSLQVLN